MMYPQILDGAKRPVRVWADLEQVEDAAKQQLRNTANLPWVDDVVAMPDVHFGMGATVGSVVVTRDAVSPAVVGVDIGCGMSAVKTVYRSGDLANLATLRHSIERSVPVGFNDNKNPTDRTDHLFSELGKLSTRGLPWERKARLQLGTLGGGNHFIEVCVDSDDWVWVMLHSGSRGIGNQLARQHLEVAKGLFRDLIVKYGDFSCDPDLAALVVGTSAYEDYMSDLLWCQRYAKANRSEMMLRVLKDLSHHLHGYPRPPRDMYTIKVDCHHNYIEVDDANHVLITRKGAVSAKGGELGIIPGSMGARSFIVRGLGNANAYCSCSHGAGRRMSRGAARRQYTVADLASQTEGVECRKDVDVVDEIPGAYKDIDQVIAAQSDLVEVVATLKQVLCVKG